MQQQQQQQISVWSLCEDKLLDWSDFDEDKYVKRRKRLIMLKFSMLKKSKLSQEDVDQVMGNNL
jgi:hypothetical protein